MKLLTVLFALAGTLQINGLQAGEVFDSKSPEAILAEPAVSRMNVSHEVNAHYGYVFDADVNYNGKSGKIDEQNADFSYVASIQVAEYTYLRLGTSWERFSFGLPEDFTLPNTLQSINAIVGIDTALADEWLMRIEFAPGLYSDFSDISAKDFNVPITFGLSYLVNENLQWFIGGMINPFGSQWIMGGGGVRWQFADQWVLNFIFPKPRLEYKASDHLTLYVGGEIKGGTYRISDNFGDGWDKGELNESLMTYTEVRAGGGVNWKVCNSLFLEAEGGYMLDREFRFHRTDVKIATDPAPYAQVGIKAKF